MMGRNGRTVEHELARLAARSCGVVTRAQLLEAGITRKEIEHRLRKGGLLREHASVYRVGHRAPSVEATYLAAVWAAGPEALLWGGAAGFLHKTSVGPAPRAQVLTLTRRRLSGVRTVQTRCIDPRDRTATAGIPVTTVARTLVDMAADLDVDALAHCCHQAGVRHGTTPRQVVAVLERRPNSPGAARLHVILRGDAPVTLSRLESGFLGLLRRAGLPLPRTNRPAGGRHVDCRWPDLRLTVELDSYRFHHSRHAWEQDRRREREARARGDEFRRYTWGDVFETPSPTVAELRELIAGRCRI